MEKKCQYFAILSREYIILYSFIEYILCVLNVLCMSMWYVILFMSFTALLYHILYFNVIQKCVFQSYKLILVVVFMNDVNVSEADACMPV